MAGTRFRLKDRGISGRVEMDHPRALVRMRVAEVAPPWLAVPPVGYGGIEWVVSLLSDGLVQRGHDVTLFATGDSRTRARLEHVFSRAPGPSAIESIWHDSVHTLFAFRRAHRFDVVHTHSRFSAVVAGALADVPVVHTIHSDLSEEMRLLYSLVGSRSWFVAISEAQRAQMPELPFVGVIHNGIKLSGYPFRPEKEDYVLFLGRAHPDKGILRAVMAAREARVPLVLAVKVADPIECEHWERDVLPALPPGTTVLSEITHEEKVDLLGRARALLFPIDWEEPFGLVMTEAMACGTPVIATARGAVPEVVEDGRTGFVLPVEGYPERAAEALREIGEIDPAACRERVANRFSEEAMVAGYERAFAVAVEGPSSVGATASG